MNAGQTQTRGAEDAKLRELYRLGYAALFFWPGYLIAGFMAFDAPNAAESVLPHVVLGLCFAYGALPFIAPVIARMVYARGNVRTAHLVARCPLLVHLVPAAFFTVGGAIETMMG